MKKKNVKIELKKLQRIQYSDHVSDLPQVPYVVIGKQHTFHCLSM